MTDVRVLMTNVPLLRTDVNVVMVYTLLLLLYPPAVIFINNGENMCIAVMTILLEVRW